MSNERPSNSVIVSFIITTHNQESLIRTCLNSLPWQSNYAWEAVVVDDCSTDRTVNVVREVQTERSLDPLHRLKVEVLSENSGGPSEPRNYGIGLATGEFVFFVDGDDELDIADFDAIIEHVLSNDADVTRLPMKIVVDGGAPRTVDRVEVNVNATALEILEKCITMQSMGVMAFSRRSIIAENGLVFDSRVKMGEDLIFMSELCRKAETFSYFDKPLYVYKKSSRSGSSATTRYSGEVFVEAVHSWDKVQRNYLDIGIDFLRCHGAGTVSYGLGQMQNFFVQVSESEFGQFSDFAKTWRGSLNLDAFGEPFRVLVEDAIAEDYGQFLEDAKLRLLIAGSDLKFIKSAIPELNKYFQIRVDEWKAERVFDEENTRKQLAWAQVIWCEWMTLAAEFFSHNVRPSQKLFIRCHFYELTRDSGFAVDDSKVNGYIAIALHTYEDLVEKFGITRSKVHLIPNYYAVDSYSRDHSERDPFAIALIGSVPRRKGLHRALEILRDLREVDDRYSLTIFGKGPKDFGWVNGVAEERQYYDACQQFIEENGMGQSVIYPGWADIRTELSKYGYVLSTSDFEGSHVAPGEAYCADIPMGILNWRGAEFVYPEEFIYGDIKAIVQDILRHREEGVSSKALERGREFFRRHQDLPQFARDVKTLVQNN